MMMESMNVLPRLRIRHLEAKKSSELSLYYVRNIFKLLLFIIW